MKLYICDLIYKQFIWTTSKAKARKIAEQEARKLLKSSKVNVIQIPIKEPK